MMTVTIYYGSSLTQIDGILWRKFLEHTNKAIFEFANKPTQLVVAKRKIWNGEQNSSNKSDLISCAAKILELARTRPRSELFWNCEQSNSMGCIWFSRGAKVFGICKQSGSRVLDLQLRTKQLLHDCILFKRAAKTFGIANKAHKWLDFVHPGSEGFWNKPTQEKGRNVFGNVRARDGVREKNLMGRVGGILKICHLVERCIFKRSWVCAF
jgi:hypothetical protein